MPTPTSTKRAGIRPFQKHNEDYWQKLRLEFQEGTYLNAGAYTSTAHQAKKRTHLESTDSE